MVYMYILYIVVPITVTATSDGRNLVSYNPCTCSYGLNLEGLKNSELEPKMYKSGFMLTTAALAHAGCSAIPSYMVCYYIRRDITHLSYLPRAYS